MLDVITPAPEVSRTASLRAATTSPSRRRAPLVVAGALLVTTGLAVSGLGAGLLADALGDALYAALVWVVLAFVAVRRSVPVVTIAAVGVCAVVEVAQLSGIPASLTAVWPPARYLLGTTFAAPDLLAYAAGAVIAAVVASVSGARRSPTP